MVSRVDAFPLLGSVPPPWCTRSNLRVLLASHVFSSETRNSRLVQLFPTSTICTDFATSGWATEKPRGANTVTSNSALISYSPNSWRTKYSSLPPTWPGTHHSMLIATDGLLMCVQSPRRTPALLQALWLPTTLPWRDCALSPRALPGWPTP